MLQGTVYSQHMRDVILPWWQNVEVCSKVNSMEPEQNGIKERELRPYVAGFYANENTKLSG